MMPPQRRHQNERGRTLCLRSGGMRGEKVLALSARTKLSEIDCLNEIMMADVHNLKHCISIEIKYTYNGSSRLKYNFKAIGYLFIRHTFIISR